MFLVNDIDQKNGVTDIDPIPVSENHLLAMTCCIYKFLYIYSKRSLYFIF